MVFWQCIKVEVKFKPHQSQLKYVYLPLFAFQCAHVHIGVAQRPMWGGILSVKFADIYY